jgi:hypothetical protein
MNHINFSNITKLSNTRASSYKKYIIAVKKEIQILNVIPVYTDGSCINNGKPNAISSIGIYFPTKNELYFQF